MNNKIIWFLIAVLVITGILIYLWYSTAKIEPIIYEKWNMTGEDLIRPNPSDFNDWTNVIPH
jgi:hypothetical protein